MVDNHIFRLSWLADSWSSRVKLAALGEKEGLELHPKIQAAASLPITASAIQDSSATR